MEHIPPKGRSVEEYTEQFVVKKDDMPRIRGNPNYLTCKPVLDRVKTNLINMLNPRDNTWGKLHIVSNTSQIPREPAQQVVRSTN